MNFYPKITISLFVFFLLVLTINNRIDNRIENKIESKLTSGFFDKGYPKISIPANFNSNKILKSSLPDLTFAANKSIDAVVHVKNTSIVKDSDSWALQFFYGDDSRKKVGTGSGVIISPDGYIITNYHVIENSTEVIVTTNDNREYEAEIIGFDEVNDIAVLKIDTDSNLDYIFFGDSDSTLIGEWVLAVGNPYNLNSTVTAGIISSKSRDLNEFDQKNQSFIQTDAAVNFGNSGGALVNIQGELIGINTLIQSMTGGYVGYSFAVPSNTVRKIFEDILEYGDVQKGLLGVRGVALRSSYSKQLKIDETEGFYIDVIEPGFGADNAGLQKGDIIKSVDDVKINRFSDLSGYLSSKRPGDKVSVKYIRDKQLITVSVTLKKDSN
ncbi:trypsin-like peptidase domain-containing protein [Flavobacteriaceae bacterium]|nr:trypsin-like peptidase domain-containing protein [Flavobacteriaceae bacterium]